jgi:hypothetical protein
MATEAAWLKAGTHRVEEKKKNMHTGKKEKHA